MNSKKWLIIGGVMGFLAVIFGAFGAHGVEEAIPGLYTREDLPASEKARSSSAFIRGSDALHRLHDKKLATWKTGVRYQFYHTFAILAVGIIVFASKTQSRLLDISGWLFLLGTIGFSGSIYVLVVSKISFLGMTAALGGVIFLGGWVFFVLGVKQLAKDKSEAN